MKTKVVQHVPRIIINVFKVFKFLGFQRLADIFYYTHSIPNRNNKENNVFKDGIGVQGLRFKVVKFSSLIPWDLGHAEQLLFSCLWSKVTYVKCQILMLILGTC